MPRPVPYRQRLQRIRILFLVCASIVGSYLLIEHSNDAVIPALKSFKFSSDFLDRYAYANEDAMGMMLPEGEDRFGAVAGVGEEVDVSEPPSRILAIAKRLIDSGGEDCQDWTIPTDGEIEERRSSGCWKDTHYRQIKGYLDKAEVDKTYRDLSWHNDLNNDNIRSFQTLLYCLPYFGTADLPEGCHDNMLAVIVTQDWWIDMAVKNGSNSGEAVWLRTVVDTLQEENTTIISLSHWNYKALVILHKEMPDVITSIYAADFLVTSCLADPRCRSDFPPESLEVEEVPLEERGTIPSWKLLAFTYWGARPPNHTKTATEFGNRHDDGFSFNPLGNEWTISPFPYPNHTYIPMTLEKACTQIDVVPQNERRDEVTVLGKLFQYFYPHRIGAALPLEVWRSFKEETLLTPIANARALRDDEIEQDTPEGLVNRGPVGMEEYNDQVAHSKAYLGVGRPDVSPSPYLALCAGVPVILPYYGEAPVPDGWDLYHPDKAQHGPAAAIGAPYVYSYHKDDVHGLYAAVRAARDNPIERYIPADMRHAHVRSEIMNLVNTNWLARSLEVEDAREARGERRQAVVPVYVLERMFERGTGRRMGADGEVSKVLSGSEGER